MKTQYIELPDEKFQEIYTSKAFRNEIAFANKCESGGEKFYVNRHYKVSEEQRQKAVELRELHKKEAIKNLGNKLVFVGMGMEYPKRFEDDVCNYRIRTELKNKEGRHFFIEVGTGTKDKLRVDHSIDRDGETETNNLLNLAWEKRNSLKISSVEWKECTAHIRYLQGQSYNNFGNIEHGFLDLKYTLQNVLKLVNETFSCDYKIIEIDNDTLRTEDFICTCNPLSFDEWYNLNTESINIELAENGADREMDFNPEKEFEIRYKKYLNTI